jgi:hypothetical protein
MRSGVLTGWSIGKDEQEAKARLISDDSVWKSPTVLYLGEDDVAAPDDRLTWFEMARTPL